MSKNSRVKKNKKISFKTITMHEVLWKGKRVGQISKLEKPFAYSGEDEHRFRRNVNT